MKRHEIIERALTKLGGHGSGHHGHKGRPGQRGGSAPGMGGLSPSVSAAVRDCIQFGTSTGRELGLYLDKDGQIVGRVEGEPGLVPGDAPPNATISMHNHPITEAGPMPPSSGDMVFFLRNEQLKEAYIIDMTGEHIYSFTRTIETPTAKGLFPGKMSPDLYLADEVRQIWNDAQTRALESFYAGKTDKVPSWESIGLPAAQEASRRYNVQLSQTPLSTKAKT